MNQELIDYNCIDFNRLLLLKSKSIGLTDQQAHLCMQMMLLKSLGIKVLTPEVLCDYSSMNIKEIDECMLELINNHYIHRTMGRLDFKPLYMRLLDEKEEKPQEEVNLVSIFEEGFGRPLSSIEIEFINTFKRNGYEDNMIIDALHEAVKAQVLNFRYIEKILENWAEHGVKKKAKPKDSDMQSVPEEVKTLEWWNND